MPTAVLWPNFLPVSPISGFRNRLRPADAEKMADLPAHPQSASVQIRLQRSRRHSAHASRAGPCRSATLMAQRHRKPSLIPQPANSRSIAATTAAAWGQSTPGAVPRWLPDCRCGAIRSGPGQMKFAVAILRTAGRAVPPVSMDAMTPLTQKATRGRARSLLAAQAGHWTRYVSVIRTSLTVRWFRASWALSMRSCHDMATQVTGPMPCPTISADTRFSTHRPKAAILPPPARVGWAGIRQQDRTCRIPIWALIWRPSRAHRANTGCMAHCARPCGWQPRPQPSSTRSRPLRKSSRRCCWANCACAFLAVFWPSWPDPQGPTLETLAADLVRATNPFRAALSQADLDRRRAAGLTPHQDALLTEWGYPFVMDEFRFHITLSGKLDDATMRDLFRAADAWFGPHSGRAARDIRTCRVRRG